MGQQYQIRYIYIFIYYGKKKKINSLIDKCNERIDHAVRGCA